MTKDLEIVDDAGDEFYTTNIPIPFYIRLKLDNGKNKYRAKVLDEAGNTRSFYTGVTDKDFLELHVPVIPLRNKGKIIVEIEVSDIRSNEFTKHQATIDYVSQEEYDSIKKSEITEEVETGELSTSIYGRNVLDIDEPEESPELTSEELAYLTQRTETFQEIEEVKKDTETIKPDINAFTQLEELNEDPEVSAELSVDEISYLIQGPESVEEVVEVEEDPEVKEFETRASVQLEELVDESEVSAELSIDELAYLTQRAEILSKSEIDEEEVVTDQILSINSDEEE